MLLSLDGAKIQVARPVKSDEHSPEGCVPLRSVSVGVVAEGKGVAETVSEQGLQESSLELDREVRAAINAYGAELRRSQQYDLLFCSPKNAPYYDPRPFCRAYETPEGEVWVEVRETFVRA